MDEKKRDLQIAEWALEAQKIKNEFESTQQYLEAKGKLFDARRGVNFYQGYQWGDTEKERKAPFEKPTINIVQKNVDSREANILSKDYTIKYTIDNDNISTDKVTKFAQFQSKEMRQRKRNRKLVHDAIIKGTGIWYVYWDESKRGMNSSFKGGTELSNLDLSNVSLANPREKDIQKQEYIIVRSREKLERVKEICDFLDDEEKQYWFVSKPLETIYRNDIEKKGEDNVTVYTKFFRQNGEVYFTKSTAEMLIQKPTAMNPLINLQAIKRRKAKEEEESKDEKSVYKQDALGNEMFDKSKRVGYEEMMRIKMKADVYPFVFLTFVEDDNSAYGVSWVRQLIAIQKIVNNLELTNFIGATKTAVPTIVVKEGALQGQKLDFTKAGSVIVDKSGNGVDGIKILNTGSLSNAHFELAQATINLVSDTYRTNDVLYDGTNVASNASGNAIAQLMSLQEKPVAQWQTKLAESIEELALILEVFYKLFYRDVVFSAEFTDAEIMQQQQNDMNNPNIYTTRQSIEFNGQDYLNTPFNPTVEVGETGRYSEIVSDTVISTIYNNGIIDKMSTESLIAMADMYSDAGFPKRKQFKQLMMQRDASEKAMLRQEIAQLKNALAMASAQNDAMKREYTNKIELYNENIRQAERMVKNQEQ